MIRRFREKERRFDVIFSPNHEQNLILWFPPSTCLIFCSAYVLQTTKRHTQRLHGVGHTHNTHNTHNSLISICRTTVVDRKRKVSRKKKRQWYQLVIGTEEIFPLIPIKNSSKPSIQTKIMTSFPICLVVTLALGATVTNAFTLQVSSSNHPSVVRTLTVPATQSPFVTTTTLFSYV